MGTRCKEKIRDKIISAAWPNSVVTGETKLLIIGIRRELFDANQAITEVQTDVKEIKVRLGIVDK